MTKPILLLTRPEAAADRLLAALSVSALRGVEVIRSPLIEIVPSAGGTDLGGASGAILTSSNGAALAPEGAGRRAFCVGAQTARMAAARGWQVAIVALDADDLVHRMTQQGAKGALVHLAGRHRRGDIAARLGTAGIGVRTQVLYDQRLRALTPSAHAALSGDAPVILPLYSPRSAANLAAQVQHCPGTCMLAISDAVARAAAGVRFAQAITVPEPTAQDMQSAIEKQLDCNRLP